MVVFVTVGVVVFFGVGANVLVIVTLELRCSGVVGVDPPVDLGVLVIVFVGVTVSAGDLDGVFVIVVDGVEGVLVGVTVFVIVA